MANTCCTACCGGFVQLAAQKEVMAEQAHSAKSMEGALRQLEERCADLREAASGHEERARSTATEAAKAQRAIDKLMVCPGSLPGLFGSAGLLISYQEWAFFD